jgi:hypothetical protein
LSFDKNKNESIDLVIKVRCHRDLILNQNAPSPHNTTCTYKIWRHWTLKQTISIRTKVWYKNLFFYLEIKSQGHTLFTDPDKIVSPDQYIFSTFLCGSESLAGNLLKLEFQSFFNIDCLRIGDWKGFTKRS